VPAAVKTAPLPALNRGTIFQQAHRLGDRVERAGALREQLLAGPHDLRKRF